MLAVMYPFSNRAVLRDGLIAGLTFLLLLVSTFSPLHGAWMPQSEAITFEQLVQINQTQLCHTQATHPQSQHQHGSSSVLEHCLLCFLHLLLPTAALIPTMLWSGLIWAAIRRYNARIRSLLHLSSLAPRAPPALV